MKGLLKMVENFNKKTAKLILALAMVLTVAFPASAKNVSAIEGNPLTFSFGTLTPGVYYLEDDIAMNGVLTISSGEVTIDLNGHTLNFSGVTDFGEKKSSIVINGEAVLNLKDTSENKTGVITSNNNARAIYVEKGTLNMHGGSIANNKALGSIYEENEYENNYGAGVLLGTESIFNMYDGKIIGNSATSGGGVYALHDSTFNMSGGVIGGEGDEVNKALISNGGGVHVVGGTLNMSGGSIKGNKASNGGGLYAVGFEYVESYDENDWPIYNTIPVNIYIKGSAEIINNECEIQGGGIRIEKGNLTLSENAKITDNSSNYGGGVDLYFANLTTEGNAIISQNKAKYSGGGISSSSSSIAMYDNSTITENTIDSGEYCYGAGIMLTSDYGQNVQPLIVGDNTKIENNKHGNALSNTYLSSNYGTDKFFIKIADGDHSPKSGMKIYVNNNNEDNYFATNATSSEYLKYFYSDDASKAVYRDKDNSRLFLDAKHTWQYTAEGDVLTASYEDSAAIKNSAEVSLKIVANDVEYTGSKVKATFEDETDWKDFALTVPEIKYYKNDVELSDAPVEVGVYEARVTVEGVTVKKEFKIKAKSSPTPIPTPTPTPEPETPVSTPSTTYVAPNTSVR